MKRNNVSKVFGLFICLVLLGVMILPLGMGFAKEKDDPSGYLPAEQLLQADGLTVKFNDPAVEKAISVQFPQLRQPDGTFTKDSLAEVNWLYIGIDPPGPGGGIYESFYVKAHQKDFSAALEAVDVSVLQFCQSLTGVSISAKNVMSLAALSTLKELSLDVAFMGTTALDVQALTGMRLSGLCLFGCDFPSYDFIATLKNLQYVDLAEPTLTDMSFLLKLPKLRYLGLTGMPHADYATLATLKPLEDGLAIDMSGIGPENAAWTLIGNQAGAVSLTNLGVPNDAAFEKILSTITRLHFTYTTKPQTPVDFSFLRAGKKLEILSFCGGNVQDLAFVSDLPELKFFYIVEHTELQSVEGLLAAPGLDIVTIEDCTVKAGWDKVIDTAKAKNLTEMDLLNCGATDVSFVKGIAIDFLWLNGNQIRNISPLATAASIQRLSLSDNPIEDYSSLTEIKGLKLLQHNSKTPLPELEGVRVVEGKNDSPWSF